MSFICFDTEDDSPDLLTSGKSGFDKQCTQIAAIKSDGTRYYNAGDVPAFLQWLERQPEKYVYALNVGYDLGNLFRDSLDELDIVMVSGRLIRANWRKKTFADVFNIWPMSVAKLGSCFGLQKLQTDSMSTDKDYVFRDVEIIRAAMQFAWTYAENEGLSKLPLTLGGLCVGLWKQWGNANTFDGNELSRGAYYGGRVELFKVESETRDVCHTDINSLYPYAMTKNFPGFCEPTRDFKAYGCADAVMQIPKMDITPLPWRNSLGELLFPVGTIQGIWTIAEIQNAERMGCRIMRLNQCYSTDESEQPYSSFISYTYKQRVQSTSEPEKLFFKLLMNNLYGRIGTGGVISRSVVRTPETEKTGTAYGRKVLTDYSLPLSDETNWMHAAYVTSYARIELLSYLKTIGAGRMIYCDTDSTIFDCAGRILPFPVGKELGQMKLESWETGATTYAPKMYRIGGEYKAKGVPKRLQREFIETGSASFDLPFKIRESIAFYDRDNAKALSVWRRVSRKNKGEYKKKIRRGNRYFPCVV